MKRHAVIVVLNADHGDLEIAIFFCPQNTQRIRKKKKKDYVMSVSKRKKHSTSSNTMITPEFIYKLKQTIDENRGQSMRSSTKSCMCLKRQSEDFN